MCDAANLIFFASPFHLFFFRNKKPAMQGRPEMVRKTKSPPYLS